MIKGQDNEGILVLDNNRLVGINNTDPQTHLDVNYLLRLSPVSSHYPSCSTDLTGGMLMYGSTDSAVPCFCNGTDWLQFDDFSTTCP